MNLCCFRVKGTLSKEEEGRLKLVWSERGPEQGGTKPLEDFK